MGSFDLAKNVPAELHKCFAFRTKDIGERGEIAGRERSGRGEGERAVFVWHSVCVCVCVVEREREREREIKTHLV